MTNYELLRWLVETRSRDVGHNGRCTLQRVTMQHVSMTLHILHGYFRS